MTTAIEDAIAALLTERDEVTARLNMIADALEALAPLAPSSAAGHQRVPVQSTPVDPAADEWGCDQCDYMGATEHALRIHITRAHRTPNDPAEVGQWSCEHCGMTFTRRSSWDRHRRTQHGDVRKADAPKRATASIPVGGQPKPVEFDGPKVGDVELGPMRRTKFDPDAVRSAAAEAM